MFADRGPLYKRKISYLNDFAQNLCSVIATDFCNFLFFLGEMLLFLAIPILEVIQDDSNPSGTNQGFYNLLISVTR